MLSGPVLSQELYRLVKSASKTCRIHILLLDIESDIKTVPHSALKHTLYTARVRMWPEVLSIL